MIQVIIFGIFKIIISLVNVLLIPINALIDQFLPSLGNALEFVSNFFIYIGDFVPWVVSYTGLTSFTLTIIIDIVVFILSVPLMVSTIKLAIAWYNKLKI